MSDEERMSVISESNSDCYDVYGVCSGVIRPRWGYCGAQALVRGLTTLSGILVCAKCRGTSWKGSTMYLTLGGGVGAV